MLATSRHGLGNGSATTAGRGKAGAKGALAGSRGYLDFGPLHELKGGSQLLCAEIVYRDWRSGHPCPVASFTPEGLVPKEGNHCRRASGD